MSFLHAFTVSITQLYATRYLSIAGTTALAYDTILTLPEEIHHVWYPLILWRRRNALGHRQSCLLLTARLLIIIVRYAMLAVAGVFLTIVAPTHNMSDRWCLSAISIFTIMDAFAEIVGTGVILHRLHLLWNFGRRITVLLIFGYSAMAFLSLSFAIFSAVKLEESQIFQVNIEGVQGLMACKILKSPRLFVMTWVPAVVIDIFASSFFFLNALARPRVESQRLLHIFYRDGVMYFLTTFCVRTMNVVLTSITGPDEAGLFSVGILFSGTMVTVAATRSFLRLFHTNRKVAMYNCWMVEEDGMDEPAECECCLSWAHHDDDALD